MRVKRFIVACNVLLIAVLACTLTTSPGSNQPDLAGTITSQAQTLQVPSGTPAPAFTSTAAFTATATLTETPAVPVANVTSPTNCRSGPGANYDMVSTLNAGQSVQIVGKYSAGNYWIVNNPGGGGTCWLWGQYVTTNGNTDALPEMIPPPSPTPSIPAAPSDFNVAFKCTLTSSPILENKVHADLTWKDQATNEDGYRVYRDGSLLATLGANTSSYSDDTTMAGLIIVGSTPPEIKYGVEAFNGAGKSKMVSSSISCFK